MNSGYGGDENSFEPSDLTVQNASLQGALDVLASSESGVGFIYSALALLVDRFHLLDVVIVLEDQSAGTQIFRYGGKAVNKNFAAQFGVVPGVYCEPRVVAADDLEVVRAACQQELLLHQTRLVGFHETRAQLGDRHDESLIDQAAAERNVEIVGRPHVARSALSRVTVTRSPERNARRRISVILAIVDVATLLLAATNVDGPVRFFLGLVLGIFIPGWSVVGLIKLKNAALEVGITMAVSLSLLMLCAQVLITARLWHLALFEDFTCVVCLPSLMWQSGVRLRRVDAAN
jgi:hypothetical protein